MDSAEQTDYRIVPTGACYDCGGRCVLKIHVRGGQAVRVETDDGVEPQIRACARGRALRKHIYSPERLLYPLRRTGPRGEGTFERISWDAALDEVAGGLKRIKETYGPKAILAMTYSGGAGTLHGGTFTLRPLLRALGGYTSVWGGASAESSVFASRATYGTLTTGHTRDDLANSKLIILWGVNPAESVYSTNTGYYLAQAKEAGARIVVVDPRYTNTVATLGDLWIPIKPATDTAMMMAMAHVIITEGLQDSSFIERFTTGFDRFKEYVLGIEDGLPKTPSWAEARTGVPADIIASLAREYAATKPAALIPGFAPGRTAHGEQYHRAASVLAAMTGNVGVPGGGAGGFERPPVGPMVPPSFTDLLEGTSYEARLKTLDVRGRLRNQPHGCCLWDAILQGTAGGYPTDIKMAYVAFSNPLNQFPHVNKGIEALKKLESVVVHDQFMTATARFADILLPVTTIWERNDIGRAWLGGPYFLYLNKAVEPPGECRSDIDICRELARRLGLSVPFLDLTEDEMISQICQGMGDIIPEVPDIGEFKRRGVHKMSLPRPAVAFEKQIQDPDANPFPTLSGKIEIYSQLIADLGHEELPAVPKYLDPWEGPSDPMIASYPLQLVTFHHKSRAHSCFASNPWLQEIEPQALSMSVTDARKRGISSGDSVRVFNDRGETIVAACVTERIMPGVVAMGEGAWYRPDAGGRDTAGSVNILTRDWYAPGGGYPYNSCLVQVEKLPEQTGPQCTG